jgi:hypothetical protein
MRLLKRTITDDSGAVKVCKTAADGLSGKEMWFAALFSRQGQGDNGAMVSDFRQTTQAIDTALAGK